MRFFRRSLVGPLLLATTVGLLAYAGQTLRSSLEARWAEEPRNRPARERVFAVNVVRIEPGTVTPVLTSFGEVRSRRALEVRARTGGAVVRIGDAVEEGGRVRAGELLLQVDPADAQSALDVARTDLAEAEAELAEAESALVLARDELASEEAQVALREQALARQRNLLSRGVGTEAAVETAALAEASARQAVLARRQALQQAAARIDQANTALARRRIALAEAERRLAETRVHAEFPGTLSEVAVVEGGVVQANERIARLIDPTELEVAFRLSTPQYARLLGPDGELLPAEVTVTLDVLGVDLATRGRISRESAVVGEGQTGRQLFARLDEARGFRPGDFVTVRIDEPPLDRVALLPATAVDAASEVLLLGEGDRLESAAVEVLRRQGDDLIVRARGLAGREAVAERSPLLGAGIRVRPLRPDDAEAPAEPAGPELVELTDERRARLVAFVESNRSMPEEAKRRVLSALAQQMVPARIVARIESRMGG